MYKPVLFTPQDGGSPNKGTIEDFYIDDIKVEVIV